MQTAVQTVNFAASDIASSGSNYINFILALTRPATPEPTATPGVHSVVVEPQWYYPEFALHATDACQDEPMRSADEDGWGYDLENRTSYEYSLTVSSRRLPDFANDMLDNSHIMLYAELTTPPQG